jgi:predicted NBD/HSP70 family sugar kinase
MNYLVIDIGGTNTRFAFFRNKKLIEQTKYETIKDHGLLVFLINKIREIQKKFKVKKFDGICVSAPGFLESDKLKLTAPTNLPKIKNLNLSPLKKFTKKLILMNDGDCAVIGAYSLEKQSDNSVKNLACLTLGTGFGCGLILNREIYKGRGVGSEFGHTTINLSGKKDNSGNYGTIENYVSIRGLKLIMRKIGLNVGTRELNRLAGKGNTKALGVYREFSKYVATAIVNIANTLDLDAIYITGGLVHGKRFFFRNAVLDAKSRFFKGINPKIHATSENLSILGGLELLRNA